MESPLASIHWLGPELPRLPLLLTCPHAGEKIPHEASWLLPLPKEILLLDVDRFVDELYTPAIQALSLPCLTTEIHRYAADLNRFPTDIDQDSVQGCLAASGSFPKGFHWVVSTQGHRLLNSPIPPPLHQAIVSNYHDPFHRTLEAKVQAIRAAQHAGNIPGHDLFHLDCHSMPSRGTAAHDDAGRNRAEIVISDCEGRSCRPEFMDAVVKAFETQGLQVARNTPYKGGRITQKYGKPLQRHHTIQIEINRSLYMSEQSREKKEPHFSKLQEQLTGALELILASIHTLIRSSSA